MTLPEGDYTVTPGATIVVGTGSSTATFAPFTLHVGCGVPENIFVCDPCAPPGPCQEPGVCDPTTGQCVYAPSNAPGCNVPVCVTIERGLFGDVADALINSGTGTDGSQDASYGSSNSLTASVSPSGQRQALLRFDLSSIPGGATISSATATLDVLLYGGAPVRAHRATAPWSESTVTWASFAEAYLPQVEAIFPAVNGSLPGGTPTTADLTAIVQAWVSGAAPNDGLLLERDLGSTVFASSEYLQASRPKLDVCYTLGP
jgi:hypothetical protein